MLTIHRSKGLEFPIVYLPVPVGAGLHPDGDPQPIFFHDPAPATRARSTSAWTGADFAAHQQQHDRRAARRGPAPGLRRADPRAAPGGRLVGAARGTAATRALGRLLFARDADGNVAAERARRTPTTPRRSTRFEELAARGARAASASSARRSGCRRRGRAARADAGELAAARFDRDARLAAGAARPTATSPPARTRRGWRASPRRPSSTTSRRTPRPPPSRRRRRRGRRCARSRRCSPPCRPASHVGTFVHRRASRRPTSPRRTSTPSSPRRSRRRRRGGRVDLGDPGVVVAGPARGDRDAARPAARRRCGCATSRAPTGSTSSTSSCRSPAATTRPARLTLAAIGARAARAPAAGRPARRLRRAARRPGAARERPRLPDRQHRPRARAGAAASRASRSSTTRRTGSAPPGEALTAWHHRPAALAAEMERAHYGAAGAALHRRAAPLPALAAARLRPRAQPRRRAVPVRARDGRRRTRRSSTARRAACSPGGRRRRSSRR